MNFPAPLQRIKSRLSESPIAYRLARGAFWSMLGGIASRLLTMIASILMARILGKGGYGEVGIVQSTLGMFGIMAGFGLGATATKYVAENRVANPDRARNILGLVLAISLFSSGVIAIGCAFSADWLASKTLNRPDLSALLEVGSLLLFFSALGGVLSSILSGFESFRKLAWINVIQGVSATILIVPLVWKFGVMGAVYAFTLQAIIGTLLLGWGAWEECRRFDILPSFGRQSWDEWPVIWHFAIPTLSSGLLLAPVTWVTNVILVNRPDGYGELGLFNAANQWRQVILFVPNLLMSSILPILAETHGRSEKDDFQRTVSLNIRATWVLALPPAVLLITLGQPLTAIFGRQFHGAASVLAILMTATFLNVVNSVLGIALAGAGKMWMGMWMNLAWAAVLVICASFLVPSHAAMGLAWAYLLAYLSHTIWQTIFVGQMLVPGLLRKHGTLFLYSGAILALSVIASFLPATEISICLAIMLISMIPLMKFLNEIRQRLKTQ